MKVHKNIGGLDLVIRILVLGIAIYLGYRISAWFYLFAVWEFFTIITRWCFVYDLLKIDTLGKKSKSEKEKNEKNI